MLAVSNAIPPASGTAGILQGDYEMVVALTAVGGEGVTHAASFDGSDTKGVKRQGIVQRVVPAADLQSAAAADLRIPHGRSGAHCRDNGARPVALRDPRSVTLERWRTRSATSSAATWSRGRCAARRPPRSNFRCSSTGSASRSTPFTRPGRWPSARPAGRSRRSSSITRGIRSRSASPTVRATAAFPSGRTSRAKSCASTCRPVRTAIAAALDKDCRVELSGIYSTSTRRRSSRSPRPRSRRSRPR